MLKTLTHFLEFYSEKPLLEDPSPLVFIGDEDSYLITILFMQKEKFKFSSIQLFDQSETVSFNTNSLLMRRYNLIMKAKKANIFGIIVMNSNVQNYRKELTGITSLLDRHEKKHYTFTMNKLNEAKIKNFPEIDVYVVISCPKSCFYEYTDFHKTIILPYELRIAFGEIEWDCNILLETEYVKYELKPEEELETKLNNQLVAL